MPRHGRHRRHHHHSLRRPMVLIPQSNAACLVFPYDQINKRFKTENYHPSQTQDRSSLEEIEAFLNEINQPVAEWYEKYAKPSQLGCCASCLLIMLMVLCLPLIICFICWSNSKQAEVLTAKDELKVKVAQMITEKAYSWTDRKLTWKIPIIFPTWIELWTGQSLPPMQPGFGVGQPGIQTTMMQQGQPGMNMGMGNNHFESNQQFGYPLQGNQNQFGSYGANTYGGQSMELVNL